MADEDPNSASPFLIDPLLLRDIRASIQWTKGFRASGNGVRFRNDPNQPTLTITQARQRPADEPPQPILVQLGIDDSDTTNGVYASSTIVNWSPGTGDADTEEISGTTVDCIVINAAEYFVTTPATDVQLADLSGTYLAVQIDMDTTGDTPKPVLVTFAPITRQWTIIASGDGWSVVAGEITGSNFTYDVIGQAAGGAAFLTGVTPTIPDAKTLLVSEPSIGFVDIDYATHTVSLTQTNAEIRFVGCGSS